MNGDTVDLGPFSLDTIVCGDCLDVMRQMPDGCVDAVITDPPYAKEYQSLWRPVAEGLNRIATDGAHLFTLVGQYQIPDVLDAFDGFFSFRWLCIVPNWRQPIMHGWNIKVCQKPCLWFTKGKGRPSRLLRDNFALSPLKETVWEGKSSHKWGQGIEMAAEPIACVTEPGDVIFDPFIGSGTTAVAAKKLGRHYFGCDINEAYVKMANERVAKVDGVQLELTHTPERKPMQAEGMKALGYL